MMQIPLYRIKNLHIKTGKKELLQIKQFDIHRGACYVFEGRMGSGKTTFLEILSTRRNVRNAEIKFEEKDIRSYSNHEYQEQIAVVPQRFSPPWGRVENYMIKTIKRYSHIKYPNKSLDEISRKMNMSSLLQRRMKSLTPGELRWVVLATQIAADTKVLIIDEYEQHLGKEEINKLNTILYRKINYDGITLITTTQNKDIFSRLASVIVTLENGKIISLRSFSKKKNNYRKKIKK